MSTIRIINMIVDVNRGIFVDSTGHLSREKRRIVSGDHVQFNINLVTVDTAAQELTPYPISDLTVFNMVGKKKGNYAGLEMIVADADVWNVPGHRADLNVAQGKLSVRFRLNRKALIDALGDTNDDVKVVIDIQSVTIDGIVSTLIQFTEDILNQAAREPTQVDGQPVSYVTMEEFRAMLREVTHPDAGFYKLEGGKAYLRDVDVGDLVPAGFDNRSFAALEDT